MFPWNFFGNNKSGFDPLKFLNDNHFQKVMDQLLNQMYPEYLQTMLKEHQQNQNLNSKIKGNDRRVFNEVVFETHDDVFIRIPIKDEKILNQIKIYYTLNKCVIDHLDNQNSPYTIILPATVKKKGAKAIYKDQILEIKIPKSLEWQMSEIDVNAMD